MARAGLAELYNTYLFYALSDESSREYSNLNRLRIQEITIAYTNDPHSAYVNQVKGHVLLNTCAPLDEVYECYLNAYHLNPNTPDVFACLDGRLP